MNKNIIAWGAGIAVVVIILYWWLKEQEIKEKNQSLNKKDKRIDELEVNNLHLIQELLKTNSTLPDIVKKQLVDLIANYEVKNAKIALEVRSIVRLIEAEEYEKAVMAIAKIIEVILKNKLAKQDDFKNRLVSKEGKKRRAVFNDYIEHAQSLNIITKGEYLIALGLKEYRNEEAHEIGVKRELNYNMGSILSGIELIVKFDNYQLN